MTNYTSTRSSTCSTCASAADAAARSAAEAAAAAAAARAERERRSSDFCLNIILAFLAALLTFTFGLLVGAATAILIFIALPALIVLAIILAILIITLLIFKWCRRDRSGRCGCCR